METTLYADVLFLVNFSMDFISLWAAALLGARARRAWRMSAAACIGGLYGVFSVLMGISGIWVYVSAAAVSAAMCLAAFGKCGGISGVLRQSALVWGCGAMLGGIMTALLSLGGRGHTYAGSVSGGTFVPVAAGCAGALYLIVRMILRRKDTKFTRVTLTLRWNSVTFDALCDSGNLMRDPMTGDACMLLSDTICARLLGKALTAALVSGNTAAAAESGICLRVIPRKNKDGSSICLAFVPGRAEVVRGKRKSEVSLTVVPTHVPENYFGGFPATLPSSL